MSGRLPASANDYESYLSGDSLDRTPPPPYPNDLPSPLILAETRTTRTEVVTTTTETTTHLLTFPSPKQRIVEYPHLLRLKLDAESLDHDAGPSSSTLNIDKALPPTPFPPYTTSDGRGAPPVNASLSSTSALAHTALGLGLSHIIPHDNTVVFTSSTDNNSPQRMPFSSVRRAKSSQKLADSRMKNQTLSTQDMSLRRSRGLSFGAVSFLSTATTATTAAKGKGKEKGERELGSQASPKGLTRKPSSFWMKRAASQSLNSPPLPSTSTVLPPTLPPLPQLPSVSTFDLDNLIPSPTVLSQRQVRTAHFRGLSRSRSDKLLGGRIPESLNSQCDIQMQSSIIDSFSPTLRNAQALPLPPPSRTLPHVAITPKVSTETVQSNNLLTIQPQLRPRAQTNPPILHRLSMAMFSMSDSSSTTSPTHKYTNSPSSFENTTSTIKSTVRIAIPQPLVDVEPPDIYVSRLRAAVSKAEVAGILASSSDPFHLKALRAYLHQFKFHDDPLDIALRKLLMEVGLPRETQQIDRVMEAFAFRYLQCNPDLFISDDQPYVLAFSLIMLHTDAFNRSNKMKMTKADYIKNTKLPGVSSEVLGCFYDNITFAPFIFIEDTVDVNGQVGVTPEMATRNVHSPSVQPGGGILGKTNKIDPYYLIENNLLGSLRVNINAHICLEDPFVYEGTCGPWDDEELQRAFSKANVIEIEPLDSNRTFFNLSVANDAVPPTLSASRSMENTATLVPSQLMTMKVTKAGLLNRKDDISERGKKVSIRRWRTWSVILTGSQLLFFRDSSLALNLIGQCQSSNEQVVFPRSVIFKPDEIFSVKDALAVYDKSYIKHENTLRFVLADGRQLLLQAPNVKELNEWLSRINYASAFKSAGVRMRPLGMSYRDVELTGVAAATSHLHDIQVQTTSSPITSIHSWDSDTPRELMGMLSGDVPSRRPRLKHRVTLASSRDVDLDLQSTTEVVNAEQFETTFNQVKADLVTSKWASKSVESLILDGFGNPQLYDSPSNSPSSKTAAASRLSSRSDFIEHKLQDLESKLGAIRTQLESDLRLIRNIAILRPFQTTTRSRLTTVVQNEAKRITLLRLDFARLACHCAVLRHDLEAEGRSWNQAKHVALQAARTTLQRRRSETLPRMTLSLHDDNMRTGISSPEISCRSTESGIYLRSNSSTSDSFHSAVDFGSDWPPDESTPTSTSGNTSQIFDSPRPSFSASYPFPEKYGDHSRNTEFRRRPSVYSSIGSGASEQKVSSAVTSQNPWRAGEEQALEAEMWNLTRCAQRVSLIQVPSDIQFSGRR